LTPDDLARYRVRYASGAAVVLAMVEQGILRKAKNGGALLRLASREPRAYTAVEAIDLIRAAGPIPPPPPPPPTLPHPPPPPARPRTPLGQWLTGDWTRWRSGRSSTASRSGRTICGWLRSSGWRSWAGRTATVRSGRAARGSGASACPWRCTSGCWTSRPDA